MSSIINKVKDAVHPGTHTKSTEVREGTAGPHNSRMANAADPRVDSDRDNRSAPGSHLSSGNQQYTATSGMHSNTAHHGPMDDMGMTGSNRHAGNTGHTGHAGLTGHSGLTGHTGGTTTSTGMGYGTNTHAQPHTGPVGAQQGVTSSLSSGPAPHTAGLHKSDMANKIDPRVDSDLDGSKTLGGNSNRSHHTS